MLRLLVFFGHIYNSVKLKNNISINTSILYGNLEFNKDNPCIYHTANNKFGMLKNDSIKVNGVTLYRIQSVKDFEMLKLVIWGDI